MDPDQKFIAFIEEWAEKQGCDFIIEDFDGHESPELIDGMAVDGVWGWLVPKGVTEKSDEYFGCVEWSVQNGNLILTWNTYDEYDFYD